METSVSQHVSKGTSITSLPPEVLHNIFTRVNNDIGNEALLLSEVCKDWYALVRGAMCRVALTQRCSPVAVIRDLSQFENLESLEVQDSAYGEVWGPAFATIGSVCKRISSISLAGIRPGLSSTNVSTLFRSFPNLLHLSIESSLSLSGLPPLDNLPSLLSLSLNDLPSLESVPPLQALTTLTSLSLTSLRVRALPPLHALTNLRHLTFCGTKSIVETPQLGGLRLLSTLDLRGCDHLLRIDLRGLPSLRTLRLGSLRNLSDVRGLPDVVRLLDALDAGCFSEEHRLDLAALLDGATGLRQLSADLGDAWGGGVDGLSTEAREAVRGLGALTGLRALELEGLSRAAIDVERPLSALSAFRLQFSDGVKCMPLMVNPSTMPALTSVEVLGCGGLKSVAELSAVGRTLRSLSVFACTHLRTLPDFHSLPHLTHLQFSLCPSLVHLPTSLSKLPFLTTLHLEDCRKLRSIPPLGGLHRLRELCLVSCGALVELPELRGLLELEVMEVDHCSRLRGLPKLPPGLRMLGAQGCESLAEVSALEGLRNLKELELSGCVVLERLPQLCGLTSLLSLRLENCKRLAQIPPLGNLLALRRINLAGCLRLGHVPPIGALRNLRVVETSECMLPIFEGGVPPSLVILHCP